MSPVVTRAARYMTRFRCLGGACEDTCCAGWTVPIDEPTHRRLKVLAAAEPMALQLLEEGIELTPNGSSFGRLKFGASGRCRMLDDTGLCGIHARLGTDALFDVCVTYPRYYSDVDGELELFGTVSCPEIARLCLLEEDSLELERTLEATRPRKLRNQFTSQSPYFRAFALVRAAFVELLSTPGPTLAEKSFALLWVAGKLGVVVHAQTTSLASDELTGALRALLEPRLVDELTASYRALELDGRLALSVIQSSLGEPAVGDPAAAWTEHVRRRAEVEDAALARLDECLTRYAINHLYTTPYMLSSSLPAYARDLTWRTAVLRYLLQRGLSGFKGSPAEIDRRVVEVVYRFGRRIEHSPLFDELGRLLEEQGLDTFAHTVGFLRV